MNRVYRAVNIQKQSFFQMLKRRERHMEKRGTGFNAGQQNTMGSSPHGRS